MVSIAIKTPFAARVEQEYDAQEALGDFDSGDQNS